MIEIFYSGEVRPGIRVQPGVQFLDDPGGLKDEPDVLAPTLKVTRQFLTTFGLQNSVLFRHWNTSQGGSPSD